MRLRIALRLTPAALALLASACGPIQPSTNDSGSGPLPINWETPFYHGRILRSLSEAQEYVAFKVVIPDFGVEPALMQVEDPKSVELTDRTLAFVFHLEPYGIVIVKEDVRESSLRTEADFQRQVDNPPRGAKPGEFRMVSVRSERGLLHTGKIGDNPNGVALIFVEGGVTFTISGPTLTSSEAMELANRL